jgi:hypothetical protein
MWKEGILVKFKHLPRQIEENKDTSIRVSDMSVETRRYELV